MFSLRATLAAALLLAAAACGDPAAPIEPTVAVVMVSPPTRTLQVGARLPLAAIIKASDGEILDRPVTWTSENDEIASVSETGVVTAAAPGEAVIRATSGGRFGRAVITVQPVPPVPVAEVRLNVDDVVELAWNGSAQLAARAFDADGVELADRPVTWTTSHSNIVTVEQGLVRAVRPGSAIIAATIEGKTASVGIRVKQPAITAMEIEGFAELEIGDVMTFAAKITRENGDVAYEPAAWASNAPAVARVEAADPWYAAVSALAEGTATLTISKEGFTTSRVIRVTPRPVADLIYNRWVGAASEIFTLDLSTPDGVPVGINAGNVSREPSPSPDGSKLVFAVSQRTPMGDMQNDLYIVNRNGLGMRWLTRASGIEDQPKWSPDGTKILFRGESDGRSDLFVINEDGTGQVNVTAGIPTAAMSNKRNPSWSPDGRRIAFVGAVEGRHKIWIIEVDGSELRPVTSDAGFDVNPSFSPDGRRIAFVRYNTAAPAFGDDVMIVPVEGGNVVRLALPGDQRTPVWSPDGLYLAISGTSVAGTGQHEIYTLRPDGSGLRLRTVNPAWGGGVSPAWIVR